MALLDGFEAKCRPDYYIEPKGLIVDIKKAADASPDGFTKADAKFKYYVQAAWYIDLMRAIGKPVHEFIFVVVEAKAPFMVGIYRLSDAAIEFGRIQYRQALRILNDIDKFNQPVYRDMASDNFVQTIDLPAYVYSQNKNFQQEINYYG